MTSELRQRKKANVAGKSSDKTLSLLADNKSSNDHVSSKPRAKWQKRQLSNPMRMFETITIRFETPKLGVRVKPGDDNKGLFVASVTDGAPPMAKEKLIPGYQILSVNEHKGLEQSDFDESVKLFASLTLPIFVVFRPPRVIDKSLLLENKANDTSNHVRRGANGHRHSHSHRRNRDSDDNDGCYIGLALTGYALSVMFVTYLLLFGMPFQSAFSRGTDFIVGSLPFNNNNVENDNHVDSSLLSSSSVLGNDDNKNNKNDGNVFNWKGQSRKERLKKNRENQGDSSEQTWENRVDLFSSSLLKSLKIMQRSLGRTAARLVRLATTGQWKSAKERLKDAERRRVQNEMKKANQKGRKKQRKPKKHKKGDIGRRTLQMTDDQMNNEDSLVRNVQANKDRVRKLNEQARREQLKKKKENDPIHHSNDANAKKSPKISSIPKRTAASLGLSDEERMEQRKRVKDAMNDNVISKYAEKYRHKVKDPHSSMSNRDDPN